MDKRHAYPNVSHDSTKERPQLPDSPFGLGAHNWPAKFTQTGILSLSRGYKEEEDQILFFSRKWKNFDPPGSRNKTFSKSGLSAQVG